MYHSIIKPALFSLPPEKAHNHALNMLSLALSMPGGKSTVKKMYGFQDEKLETKVFGLHFPNPVGLAAGFDKDGKHIDLLSNLGFGFIEVGTVTPKPQAGNPKPRLFRLKRDRALINRMGFNNEGVQALVRRLEKRKNTDIIIGGNIGKNKVTPNEEAVNDYKICFRALHDYVDYFVVNVSSPNTPGLRALQDKEPLSRILNTLKELNQSFSKEKPILLKIAPDLNQSQLDDIVEIVTSTEIDGLIATNTTISRDGLLTPISDIEEIGPGGLSGKPLTTASTRVIEYLFQQLNKNFPIIGVGGIHSGQDARQKFKAGAKLVQVYTGFVYEGPGLPSKINRHLLDQNIHSRV